MDKGSKRMTHQRLNSIGFAVIILGGILVLVRSFFGFGWGDESNYLAMVDRFMRGDLMVVHEWHPTQWYSSFLLPFYALYLWLHGSSDGVFLCFRLAYALLTTVLAILVYRALAPRKGVWPVLAGVLINLFYANAYSGTFSYNTLATNCLMLSTTGLYLYVKGKGNRLLPFLSGVAFAVAAASYPYLAVLYFAALALTPFFWKSVRLRTLILYGTLGIVAVAIPYLLFLFRGGDVSQVLDSLRYVFHDPEHVSKPPLRWMRNYVILLYRVYGPTIFLSVALDAYILIKRLMKKKRGVIEGLVLLTLGAVSLCAQIAIGIGYESAALYALSLYGLQAFMMTEKPDKPMFVSMFLPGFAFSLMIYLASNTGFRAISAGLTVSAVASCCFVRDAIHALEPLEPKGLKRLAMASATVALVVTVLVTCAMRMGAIIRPEVPLQATVAVAVGPAEGLRISPQNAARYQEVYDTIQKYASGKGNLIITRLAPWGYMVSPMRCGSPTTWRLRFNEEWLWAYMKRYPDRRPDVIISLLPAYDPRGYAWDLPEDDVGPVKLNRALIDYASQNDMERIDTKAAIIFRRHA